MDTYNETTIDHLSGAPFCGISTGELKTKNRLAKLIEQHPGELELVANNPDGSVFYHVPWTWIRISPPKKVVLTEEQKSALVERLHPKDSN